MSTIDDYYTSEHDEATVARQAEAREAREAREAEAAAPAPQFFCIEHGLPTIHRDRACTVTIVPER